MAAGAAAATALPPAALQPAGEPPSESLVGEPLQEAITASGETCLRLSEVPLEDTSAILGFVNDVGTAGFGGDPEEETIAEFVLGATIIRDAVAAWRLLTDEPTAIRPPGA